MILQELARVELRVGGEVVATHRTMEDENGSLVTLTAPTIHTPDYDVVEGLLTAAADFCAGDGIGQLIMAGISLCRTRRMRALNEKGALTTEDQSDAPF